MAKLNLAEIEEILRAHKEELCRKFGVSSIAIFGSLTVLGMALSSSQILN